MVPPRKSRAKPASASLTLAVVGVTPRSVSVRHLAGILESAAALFEAIADERNAGPFQLSLTRITNGSAAYQFASQSQQAPAVFKSLVSEVEKRGKGSSPQIRSGLARLHQWSTKAGGGLRIDPDGKVGELFLAPPLPDESADVEEGTIVYARVVGVRLDVQDRGSVTLRYDDGGSGEFEADQDMIEKSARLIGRHVEARVTFLRGESTNFDGDLEQIEARAPEGDLLESIAAARKELAERGIVVDADAWLAEERDDEEADRGD